MQLLYTVPEKEEVEKEVMVVDTGERKMNDGGRSRIKSCKSHQSKFKYVKSLNY